MYLLPTPVLRFLTPGAQARPIPWGQQWLRWIFIVLALWLVMPLRANAPRTLPITGERLALVIGNSAYGSAPLLNPGNDAKAMAALLHNAGFKVDLRLDAHTVDMQQAIQKFAREQRDPQVKTALFYYAGHAVQVDWRNYLVGTEAKIRNIDDLTAQSVDLADVIDGFGAANTDGKKQFIMVLDACRDNPFRKGLNIAQQGMSQFDAPPNTLVAFSTAPGKVALDGDGVNSYYTASLLRELSIPYVSLEDAFKRVRMGVRVASLDRQIPWESTSLEQRFYLFPAEDKETTLTADALESSIKRELAAWTKAKSSNDVTTLVGFLQDFPNGNFSQLAQFRLDETLRQRAHQEAIVVAQRQRGIEDEQQRAELAMIKAAQEQRRQEQALAKADIERQLQAQAEREKLRQEQERQEQARLEQEHQAREAQARELAQRQAQAERERLALEQQARETAAAQELAQRQAQAERERQAMEQERQAQERLARQAAEREQAARQAEQQRQAALAQERARLEQERQAREAAAQALAQEIAQRQEQEKILLAKASPPPFSPAATASEPLLATAQKLQTPLVAPLATLTQMPPITDQRLAAGPKFSGADPLGRVFRVGDHWVYKTIDRFTRNTSTMDLRVTQVEPAADRITYNNGQFYADLMGNATSTNMGALDSPRQFYPATLQLGQKWITSFMQRQSQGLQRFRYDVKITAKEKITVPAGEYLTYRIEAIGYNLDNGTVIRRVIWVAPGINANIALEVEVRTRDGRVDQTYRWELLRYSPVNVG